MIKYFAKHRMEEINRDIRQLVDAQDRLTRPQEEQLDKLDRAHRFWQQWAT